MADLHSKAQRVPRLYTQLDNGGPITSDANCPEGTRGLMIGTAGNLSAAMKGGIIIAMPVQAGFVAGEFVTVLASSSTVEDVWAAV